MDIKKSLKDVLVLLVICSVFAVALAYVNSITAPIIADRLNAAADEAYLAVMPGAKGFEDVDISAYQLPATVKEVKRETSGMGHAIKLETKGYATGMIIIVGVDANGVVTGATCVTSNETWGLEKTLGDKMVGKDINTVVDVEAGATSLTVNGYRAAVKDALNAATILGGGSVDIRTEEEILSDNLNAALGLTDCEFTKMFMVEVVNGAEKVYTENNGAGYVVVIDGKYVGVNADGVAVKVIDAETVEVTEGIDELKTSAEAAVAVVSATGELTEVALTDEYKNAYAFVTKVQKTASGNYVIDLKGIGFGILGDDSGYIPGSGEHIEIRVSLSADGKVIDAQTIYHSETDSYGGIHLKDGAYNAGFIGKTEAEANGVDTINNCTRSTRAFKYAVLLAFETVTTLEGGAN